MQHSENPSFIKWEEVLMEIHIHQQTQPPLQEIDTKEQFQVLPNISQFELLLPSHHFTKPR